MNTQQTFDYHLAFSRNIGWFSKEEQEILRLKRVAIAGCGGVGGIHTLTMARLGVANFNLSDFDTFGIENFNRQIVAKMSTINRPKLDVVIEELKDINPEAHVNGFPEGINNGNVEAFMQDVDIYIDSIDFFAINVRRKIFEICAKKNIPAVTAAPLGMGTAFLCFMPGGMTFDEYFGMRDEQSDIEKVIRLYTGIAPDHCHDNYFVDQSTYDAKEKKGSSTIIGVTMSAGVAATYAVKILLNRGELVVAPDGLQWEPYLNQVIKTSLPGGHKNPKFQSRLEAVKKQYNLT